MRGRDDEQEDRTEETIALLSFYGAQYVPPGPGWHTMKCCFHPDRNASARVSAQLGGYKCFACDMQGDLEKLVELREGCERSCAFQRVSEITGVQSKNVSGRHARKSGRTVLGATARDYETDDGLFRSGIRRRS